MQSALNSCSMKRRFLLLLMLIPVVGLVASVSACGGGVSGNTSQTSSAKEAPSFQPAKSGVLHIYTWSDYYPTDMLKKFQKETGIKTSIDYYQNNEEMIAKLEASGGSGYDLVVPTDYAVKQMILKNLLLKFNALQLPNGKYIANDFRNPYFDEGRVYSAPYLYGVTGYMYDSAKLKSGEKAPTTWKEYFTSNAAWSSKPGIHDDQTDGVNAALLATGGTPCTSDPARLQAASDILMSFKARVKNVSSDATMDRLASGENTDSMIWNGYGHRARMQKTTLKWVFPKEGALEYQDNWAIPVGAADVQQALTFINWSLKPENAIGAVKYNGYNAGLNGLSQLMPTELKNDPAIIIPKNVKLVQPPSCSTSVVNSYSKIWQKFKG